MSQTIRTTFAIKTCNNKNDENLFSSSLVEKIKKPADVPVFELLFVCEISYKKIDRSFLGSFSKPKSYKYKGSKINSIKLIEKRNSFYILLNIVHYQ